MTMTSDNKTIRNKTGFGLGNLYLESTSHPIEYSIRENVCFDDETFNFHLYPDNPETMKCIAEEVKELRSAIVKVLKEKYRFDVLGTGSKGNIAPLECEKYKGANALYRCIVVQSGKVYYTLNFMRFFIDRKRNVNCILKSFQFDRAVTINVNKYGWKKFDIAYPSSYQSQSEERLKDLLEKRRGRGLCYNPGVQFGNVEKVAEAFVRFINACEE